MIPVGYFFVLSGLLFFIGVFGFVTRRNLVAMLISVELVLNSVDINFAAFNRLLFPDGYEGMFFTLFSIGVSAAESAVALAIIIGLLVNMLLVSAAYATDVSWQVRNSAILSNNSVAVDGFRYGGTS